MGCGNMCHDILCFDDKEHYCHVSGCDYVEPTREEIERRNARPWKTAPEKPVAASKEKGFSRWAGFTLAISVDGDWAGFSLIRLKHFKILTLGYLAIQFLSPSLDRVIASQQEEIDQLKAAKNAVDNEGIGS